MTVKLYVKPAEAGAFDFQFNETSLIIGRSRQSDLIVADRFLSRKHARIYKDGDQWLLEDLGSQNGSQLDGRKLKSAEPLSPGSSIRVSDSYINVVSLDGTTGESETGFDSIFINCFFMSCANKIGLDRWLEFFIWQ